MANYQLTQTGAEVQASLDKVEGMVNIKSVGSGLSLSGEGELSASSGGTTLYRHTFNMTWVESDRTSYKQLVIICNRPTTLLFRSGSLSSYLVYDWTEILTMYVTYGDSKMPLQAIFSNTKTGSLMYTFSVYNGSWITFAYNNAGFSGTNEVIEKL